MQLTRLAVHRPLAVLMGLLALVLLGGVAYTFLKVDRLPPISIPVVSVSVSYPNASADDVEQLVTEPVENALAGMPGVAHINSTSSEGVARVTVQLADGTDVDAAAIEVGRRLAAIGNSLPSDAGSPSINKADPNASPILNVALTGAPSDQLYDIASSQLQPQLQSVPGVASVNINGGLQREIQVRVDYNRLAGYGLSVQQVATALQTANVSAPAGSLEEGAQVLNVRSVGRFESADQLGGIVISDTSSGPVYVRDVASVTDTYKPVTQVQRFDGQDAVGLVVVKQSDANAITVADAVRAELQRQQSLLPSGTSVQVTNDSSVFTRASLDAIQHDLGISIFLVATIILLFLHEWRNTLIVLLAIPTSLVSTFLVMYALGFSLNIMSLMALALMIGILVDDSIVVLENIHRHLQLGKEPRQAALDGRSEIGMAAIAITLADVVVYAPIAFMSGNVGQLFRQYGLTVVAATLFSLLISFTLTPLLASRWLRHGGKAGFMTRFGHWWDAHFDRLGGQVARVVPTMVRARWVVLGIGAGLVVLSASLVPLHLIGTEYAPDEDDGNFTISMQAPAGASLSSIDDGAREMELMVQQIPEVQHVFSTVSESAGGYGGGAGGRASIAVQLVPKDQRSRSVFDIINQVRGMSRQIPGMRTSASVSSPLGGAGGGSNSSMSITVMGPDLDTLNQVTDEVETTLADVRGLSDLQNSSLAGLPEVQVELDHDRMAQLGVTAQQVSTALRTTLGGSVASELRPTGKVQEDITLVASDTDRLDLNKLSAIPVAGATTTNGTPGPVVTLGQVATVKMGTGAVQIQRQDRNRAITLTGQAVGRPLADVVTDAQAAIDRVPMPAGYKVVLGGQVERLNSALAQLAQALVLSLVLEYMLLVALYESWLYPLVRMLAIPLGLVGSFLGLYLTGNTINIYSLIGFIMAEGLVAKSGILLVDYTNTLRERGMSRTDALAEAARVRLRPILMTSATMIFGMLPLAMKLEAGAESRAPMAVVVIGGMLSSTLLTLFVVPALYTVFDDLQARFQRKPKTDAVAPAAVDVEAEISTPTVVPTGPGSVTRPVRPTLRPVRRVRPIRRQSVVVLAPRPARPRRLVSKRAA
jgi:HAE1 family hydrophobic/amphiphilic exporter-1